MHYRTFATRNWTGSSNEAKDKDKETRRGPYSISLDVSRSGAPAAAGITLLYLPDSCPTAEDVLRLDGQPGPAKLPFRVTRQPAAEMVELLAQGLAFELAGLQSMPPPPLPEIAHRYGLAGDFEAAGLAAVRIRAGAHLRGAENLLPVVRTQVGIAATLATLPGIRAVAWGPARSALSAESFIRNAASWLDGGAFPALGLTALHTSQDGAFQSEGLRFFTGQEIRVEPVAGRSARDGARIAVRLIDALVGAEPVTQPTQFTGPDGEALRAEPAGDTGIIRITLAT